MCHFNMMFLKLAVKYIRSDLALLDAKIEKQKLCDRSKDQSLRVCPYRDSDCNKYNHITNTILTI